MTKFIQKHYLSLTIFLILFLLVVIFSFFFLNKSNQPRESNVDKISNSSNIADGFVESNRNSSVINSTNSYSSSNPSESNTTVSSDSEVINSSSSNSNSIIKKPESTQILDDIKLSPEETKQKLIEVYLPFVKAEFSNGDKLLITDKFIAETKNKSLTDTSDFKYPLADDTNFYVITKSNDIVDLGEGIVGVYEVKSGENSFRLVLTSQETGFTELYFTNDDYSSPKKLDLKLEFGYTPASITQISDSTYTIKAYNGQDFIKYKDFEVDIGKLINEQNK
jgi:hypothetical protein